MTYAFGAAYNGLLASRQVLFLHDKYVRFAKTAEGPHAKDVLKVPPTEILRTFLLKQRIDVTKQEITVNKRSLESEKHEGSGEVHDELDGNFVPETIKVTVTVNVDTGASSMNAQHFKALMKRLCAPLTDQQVDLLLKKAGKDGQLDVTYV